ncbi:radical SAM protein [Nostoc sp.]|uniref:radical SAM protein n=1 Tax=Nostoc sp. TaxID=1180 RepID=UPI002FF64F9F
MNNQILQQQLNSIIAPSTPFKAVYGPVQSWRFGRSLGIDPIGSVSTCSFNCVYCQLGKIEDQSLHRRIFVPTQQIHQELQYFKPYDIDCVTLSGSGEPTLALNLEEILITAKAVTNKTIAVLTNGSLLLDVSVREALAIADLVAVKFDAVSIRQFHLVNRPLSDLDLMHLWAGILEFRRIYTGRLAIQTMLLTEWNDREQETYISQMQMLCPDEIQLNTPTRPKPLTHLLEARGNHLPENSDLGRSLKHISVDLLQRFANRIQSKLDIPVRYPIHIS